MVLFETFEEFLFGFAKAFGSCNNLLHNQWYTKIGLMKFPFTKLFRVLVTIFSPHFLGLEKKTISRNELQKNTRPLLSIESWLLNIWILISWFMIYNPHISLWIPYRYPKQLVVFFIAHMTFLADISNRPLRVHASRQVTIFFKARAADIPTPWMKVKIWGSVSRCFFINVRSGGPPKKTSWKAVGALFSRQ